MNEGNTDTIRKRKFYPDVPAPLLVNASPSERWMYEQQSIQRQQNEAILERLEAGDVRLKKADDDRDDLKKKVDEISKRVEVFEQFKDRITAKWTVIAFVISAILAPVALAFLGAMFIRWFERVWK